MTKARGGGVDGNQDVITSSRDQLFPVAVQQNGDCSSKKEGTKLAGVKDAGGKITQA